MEGEREGGREGDGDNVSSVPHRPSLPLPETVPLQFAAVPEFFIDVIADFLIFCLQ